MKYLLVILLGLSVTGCYYPAPYDPYYGPAYPAYGAYYGPAYYPAPAISVGVGGYGGYYGHRYWR